MGGLFESNCLEVAKKFLGSESSLSLGGGLTDYLETKLRVIYAASMLRLTLSI